ncbi:MAG TPA: sugar phosphate isomerase/epimerase [Victivallales bacterium]|nr:sugar phosphate isomerase/epimerase [Victivallales bacterium]
MYFTGIADEAGEKIERQIEATKVLGWSNIETRKSGFQGDLASMNDSDFEEFYRKVSESGVRVNCFGSGIANWAKDIRSPFEETLKEIKISIPRMQKLGCKLIRIMSYAIRRDPESWRILPDSEQLLDERIRRLREMVKIFVDSGIIPLHENCMNYGGLSWKHTMRLIENVPGLKLVFDTGNPIHTPDMSKKTTEGKHPFQDPFEFYLNIRNYIEYVHIKDAKGKSEMKHGEIFPKGAQFTFPGEGEGQIPEIIEDLLRNGYDGGFSIEPHMRLVFHEESKDNKDEVAFANYVEYGRRFMNIVKTAKEKIERKELC